jgi:hypothetical protein
MGMSYAMILQSTMRATDALEANKPYSIAFSSDLVRAPTALNSLRIAETPTVHARDLALGVTAFRRERGDSSNVDDKVTER